MITDGRPQLWRYNQEFIKEAFELRADCEVTSFPSTRSESQKPLEDITSGKVTDDTTVYRTYSSEDPRFDVTAGTEVAILYKKESAYRINYRSSSASKPKQGWVSRQQINDDATDSVGPVKKGLQILQEEGSKEFVKSTKDYVFNTSPPGELEVFHVEF